MILTTINPIYNTMYNSNCLKSLSKKKKHLEETNF